MRFHLTGASILVATVMIAPLALAQIPPTQELPAIPVPRIPTTKSVPRSPNDERDDRARQPEIATGRTMSTPEIILCTAALVLIASMVGVSAWMRVRQVISADLTFKMMALSLVVGSCLFLVGAGYAQDQIAPVMAFLGTALGFVFGKTVADEPRHQPPIARPPGESGQP